MKNSGEFPWDIDPNQLQLPDGVDAHHEIPFVPESDINSFQNRRRQLMELADNPDSDMSDTARADLYREFGFWRIGW